MALTKVRAGGVNLADTYAFSGTVSGTGMDLLLSDTISSAVAQYDISSTYINSTYDSYYLESSLLPATDGAYFYVRVFVGGVIQTGSIYAYEAHRLQADAFDFSNATSTFGLGHTGVGNADGEGGSFNSWIRNVNSTTRPFAMSGSLESASASASPNSTVYGASLIPANRASIVNGLRLWFNSGNIASGTVKLYGLRK